MSKKLIWKAFETHKDQSDYGRKLFADMSMGERPERFFMMLEVRSELTDIVRAPRSGVFNPVKAPCSLKK